MIMLLSSSARPFASLLRDTAISGGCGGGDRGGRARGAHLIWALMPVDIEDVALRSLDAVLSILVQVPRARRVVKMRRSDRGGARRGRDAGERDGAWGVLADCAHRARVLIAALSCW